MGLPRGLLFVLTLLLVSCPSTVNRNPVLVSLNADTTSGAAPLTVTFSWVAANDPDGDALSCSLDNNSDGNPEFSNFDCSNITTKVLSYPNVGNFVAKLTVSDNKGGVATQTKAINVTSAVVPGSYSIVLRFSTAFPAKFIPTFQAAATRWQTIITADVPDSTQTFQPANCKVAGQTDVVGVDDLVIFVNTIAFDPQNPNLLGRAGPCFSRQSSKLTLVGVMEFVDTQLNSLLDSNQLVETVTHEMGHVLGLGTHWQVLGLTANTLGGNFCGTNPQYTGSNALREYHALGRTGNIELEDQFGPGTCEGHWKESVFGTELMTGFLNGSVANPLSRMTLGSMQDLGYSIDLSKADPYTIPAAGAATVRANQSLIITRPVDRFVP